MRWLFPEWWAYLFRNNTGWRNILCRARFHPNGPVYYNAGGTEPDWHCQDCGEDLR